MRHGRGFGVDSPDKHGEASPWELAKRFFAVFLPLAALVLAISWIIYSAQTRGARILLEKRQEDHVALARRVIVRNFDSIVSDVMVLSEDQSLKTYLRTGETAYLRALADAFRSYGSNKRYYDQIRFLDETGMERVRVNFDEDGPNVVPDDQLQFKGDRYYFTDTLRLEPGGIYVSPFDLNMEGGEIEEPLKPIIRFGMPVVDMEGRKRGVVVLNYLGEKLIFDLAEMTEAAMGDLVLLNPEGFWLKGLRPEDEWGFMYEDGKDLRFGSVFPKAWEAISGTDPGQIRNGEGMFTFTTVYPLSEAQRSRIGSAMAFKPAKTQISGRDYNWKIVCRISPADLSAFPRKTRWRMVLLDSVMLILLAVGAWFFTRANMRRKQSEEALRQSSDQIKLFAYSVSHDLKGPAVGVHGLTRLLRKNYQDVLDERGNKYIDQIGKASDQIAGLVDEINAYISTRETPLNIETVRLQDVLSTVKGEFADRFETRRIAWSEPESPPEIRADRLSLLRVLTNLVDNALKYGGEKLTEIRVGYEGSDRFHILSVTDDGVTIREEDRERIFGLFQRHETPGGAEGAGLGLAIVKEMAARHKGRVWVEPAPERGVSFYVAISKYL
jgi:signal transduction histidine kinase